MIVVAFKAQCELIPLLMLESRLGVADGEKDGERRRAKNDWFLEVTSRGREEESRARARQVALIGLSVGKVRRR